MAHSTNTLNLIQTVFQDMGWEPSTPQAHLVDDLGLDSFDFVQLVLALNQTFGVNIPSQDVNATHFANLNALSAYLDKLLSP